MDYTKNVRIVFPKDHLLLIEKAIKEYIEYSKKQKYEHSIERMTPVLHYVEKKLKSTKSEAVSLQISLNFLGSIHDAVSDYALFFDAKADVLIQIIEHIEEEMKKKFNKTNYRTLNISTRTSIDVKKHINEKSL